ETVWALTGGGLPDPVPLGGAVATAKPLRYGLLGSLEVWGDDGRPVPIASEQQRLLLAVLLVSRNRTASADRLIDELLRDRLPTDPRVALRTQVSRLRKRLDTSALTTEGAGYQLHVDPGADDASRFESLLAQAAASDPVESLRL